MANSSYSQALEILFSRSTYFKDIAFDYELSPYKEYFESFYQFCSEYLEEESKYLDVSDTKFLYINNLHINAQAGLRDRTRYIGVNSGSIVKLMQFSQELAENLPEISSLHSVFDVSKDILVFQLNTLFIFYHELGHIIQDPFDQIPILDENVTEAGYSEFHHILEMDADWYAANKVANHIIHKWDSLPPTLKSQDILIDLIKISLSGTIIFLIETFRNPTIYFQKFKHPHPTVRWMVVLSVMFDKLRQSLSLNFDECIIIVFDFIKSIKAKESLIDDFLEAIQTHLPEILKYIADLHGKAIPMENLTNKKVSV
ncbi:MAG: hypothetical protein KF860_17170 [Cyclobacteriaceae bacterium]|nr:hypothetical protein [Cyclobacteriaceae bacterium]